MAPAHQVALHREAPLALLGTLVDLGAMEHPALRFVSGLDEQALSILIGAGGQAAAQAAAQGREPRGRRVVQLSCGLN